MSLILNQKLEGRLGGSVGWTSDSISAQLMIPGLWDQADVRLCAEHEACVGFSLSLSSCPFPPFVVSLSKIKKKKNQKLEMIKLREEDMSKA